MREMKDSGIPWVGEIPAEWHVEPMRQHFKERKRKNLAGKEDNLLSLSYGNIIRKPIDSTGGLLPANFLSYNIIEGGDIVFRMTDLQNDQHSLRSGLSPERGIITSAYITTVPYAETDSRYFNYLFRAYDQLKVFYNMGSGVRQGINYDVLKRMPLVCPSLLGQQRIADYLDERCAAIDEVRRTIEDEVEALRRLRKATIHRAVTKGLDEGAPMHDSGVEWIGTIPATWQMVPNYAVFIEFKEGVGNRSDEYTLLSLTKQGVIVRDLDAGGKFPSSFDTYQVVYPGQMIFCLFDIDETPRTVGLSSNEGMITGAYDVFDVKQSVCDARFALYWYLVVDEGKHLRPYYRSLRKTLTSTMFRHVKMPLPPLFEQQRIADYLDERCAAIDSVIDTRTRQLERLDDYRRALIFAYVTGKKEVPSHE